MRNLRPENLRFFSPYNLDRPQDESSRHSSESFVELEKEEWWN